MATTSQPSSILDRIEQATTTREDMADFIQGYRSDLALGKFDFRSLRGFVLGLLAAGVLDDDTHSSIVRQIDDAQAADERALRITCGTLVERPEDMSPDGRLAVCMDNEGDILIRVIPPVSKAESYAPSVEFVAHCPRSRHTHLALRDLMHAMARDNAERPLQGQKTLLPS